MRALQCCRNLGYYPHADRLYNTAQSSNERILAMKGRVPGSALFVLFYSLCAAAQGPAGIMLLPGYKHETVPTPRDSRQGRIWKESGLEITYQYSGMDIAEMLMMVLTFRPSP